METTTCTVCCKNKTILKCDMCGNASCKYCSYFIDENSFEFLSLLPESLRDKSFCPNCYNKGAGSELEEYQETLLRAKDVNVYVKDQSSETRLIRRIQKPLHVECDDREEALMLLAFLAAQKGFDTIVDVDIKSKKSGDRSYKKLIWKGSAVPVDPKIRK